MFIFYLFRIIVVAGAGAGAVPGIMITEVLHPFLTSRQFRGMDIVGRVVVVLIIL